jgi:hypothetical protein
VAVNEERRKDAFSENDMKTQFREAMLAALRSNKVSCDSVCCGVSRPCLFHTTQLNNLSKFQLHVCICFSFSYLLIFKLLFTTYRLQSNVDVLGAMVHKSANDSDLTELLRMADFTPCLQRNKYGGCVRGSLIIDSWLQQALYTQR